MKMAFVGAGKVGNALGKYLSASHEIVGFASLSFDSAKEAAEFTGSQAFDLETGLADLVAQADLVFLTVPDGQIAVAWKALLSNEDARAQLEGKMVAHCSGALASDVLAGAKDAGVSAYSIHPLFAVPSRESHTELGEAFFSVEGDPDRMDEAVGLLRGMGNRVQVVNTQEKVRYHAAAAMASNHVVALYRLAANELVRCGFSQEDAEAALAPLFLGNARHVAADGPVASLTGPAERGDMATIERHLAVLDGDARETYEVLNRTLLELAREKHARQ